MESSQKETKQAQEGQKIAGLKLHTDAEKKPTYFATTDELLERINDVEEFQQIMGPERGSVGEVLDYELLACDDDYRTFQKGLPSWTINQGQINIAGYHVKIRPSSPGQLLIKATMINKHGKLLHVEKEVQIMPAETSKKPEDPPQVVAIEKPENIQKKQGSMATPTAKISNKPESMIVDGESTPEERKQQIALTQKTTFLAKAVELTEPTENTDSWVGGGSYAAMYFVAEAIGEGRYRDAAIWLAFALLMIIAKHGIKKGPLTQLLESSGQQAKKAYEDIRKTLRGE